MTKMLSWTGSAARRPEAGRPPCPRGIARVGLLVVWVVFWLNTALIPCCEAAAAVLGGHAESGSQSASAPPPLPLSDATHSEPLGDGHDSPCGYTLDPDPTIAGMSEVLTPGRSPLDWFSVHVPFAMSSTAAHRAADFTPARASPPHSLRLYLRSQRLLI